MYSVQELLYIAGPSPADDMNIRKLFLHETFLYMENIL